ncbi:MAG: hypothetical protein IPJ23_13475 [Ignavibacteriales bacterium]|nr:hypothetical protein [Ignavibacteriales bacterium]
MKILSAILFLSFLFVGVINKPVFAQEKPIQVALFNPIQIFPENTSITGLRLNIIYGKNVNVSGLDWGFVNSTIGKQVGAQWGFVNMVDNGFLGLQGGFVNLTDSKFEGLQYGFVNYHKGKVSGVQFGFINYAGSMYGLQIGLINIINQGGAFPFFPIVNWSF